MRALHQRVNIVPVLAKADTLTPTEVERMKNKVRGRLSQAGAIPAGPWEWGYPGGWGPHLAGPSLHPLPRRCHRESPTLAAL